MQVDMINIWRFVSVAIYTLFGKFFLPLLHILVIVLHGFCLPCSWHLKMSQWPCLYLWTILKLVRRYFVKKTVNNWKVNSYVQLETLNDMYPIVYRNFDKSHVATFCKKLAESKLGSSVKAMWFISTLSFRLFVTIYHERFWTYRCWAGSPCRSYNKANGLHVNPFVSIWTRALFS